MKHIALTLGILVFSTGCMHHGYAYRHNIHPIKPKIYVSSMPRYKSHHRKRARYY